MSNVNVTRLGPETQLDNELDYHEKVGRSFVDADPWRASTQKKAPEITALGLVGSGAWLVVLMVLWVLRAVFYWTAPYGTEALVFNGLAIAWTVLPVVVVVVGGAVWVYGEFARKRAEAQRMSITRDRFGNPIGAALVLRKDLDFAARELVLATQAEMVMAPHKQYRGVDSLSVSLSSPQGKGAQQDAPQLVAAGPNIGPLPLTEWVALIDKAPHVMLAAKTGGGKSTMARFILKPRLEAGEQVFIIDPHWSPSNWNGLPGVGAGEDWGAIGGAFDSVVAEYQRRLDEYAGGKATKDFTRLTVLVDEVALTKLAFERMGKSNPWTRFVTVLGSGARKVRVSVVLMTQSTNVADLGVSGPLRENYTRIALDSRAIRKLIEEDANRERRDALYAALPGQGDYPAATEVNGAVFFLDRSSIVDVQFPAGADRCIWEPVRPPVRSREGAESVLLSSLLADELADEPADDDILVKLAALKAAGISREKARELGYRFTNSDWTRAG